MTAEDWDSYDDTMDIWRKLVRNIGAMAEDAGSTDAFDWTSSDILIDLQRKCVSNSFQAS